MSVNNLTGFVCIALLLLTGSLLRGQSTPGVLQKKVQTTTGRLPLAAIGKLISQQTGLHFSFNASKMAAEQQIMLEKKTYTVAELLSLVQRSTGTTYKLYQEHIIFRVVSERGSAAAQSSRGKVHGDFSRTKTSSGEKHINEKVPADRGAASNSKHAFSNNKAPAGVGASSDQKRTFSNKMSANANGDTLSSQTHTFPNNNLASGQKAPAKGEPSSNPKHTSLNKTLHINPLPSTRRHLATSSIPIIKTNAIIPTTTPARKKWPWFAQAGFIADESLFAQAIVTGGLPIIHLTTGWVTNFSVSGVRYGLGSSFRVKDDWRLNLVATTGRLRNEKDLSVRDTSRSTQVRSNLHRLGILAERSFSERLVVQAGPIFNYLASSYTFNGFDNTGQNKPYTVRPPYELTSSSNADGTRTTSTWIGFQISILYRYNF